MTYSLGEVLDVPGEGLDSVLERGELATRGTASVQVRALVQVAVRP